MAKISMIARVVNALKPTDKVQLYFDASNSSFGLMVYPSGTKTFFVVYGPRNKRVRKNLGQWGKIDVGQARALAREELTKAARAAADEEKGPAAKPKLLGEWCDEYLVQVKARKKHPREDERYIERAVERFGRDTPLHKLTVSMVQQAFNKMAASGAPIGANRWLASFRACLQAAWRADLIPSNPAMKIKPNPPGVPRERVLTDEELARLWAALEDQPEPVQLAFAMLIETGARLSEVLNAKWADLDLQEATWRLPKTKSGRPQVMPLATKTVERLNRATRSSEFLIAGRPPAPLGEDSSEPSAKKPRGRKAKKPPKDKPRVDLKRPWANLVKRAELDGVHIHDLRRTFGLRIAKKAGIHVASRLLRHSDIRVTERHYAPLGIDDLRGSLEPKS